MAKTIEFLKDDEINQPYKRGEKVKVHDDIAKEKVDSGVAKFVTEVTQKKREKVENGN